jgi:hypothetical protein
MRQKAMTIKMAPPDRSDGAVKVGSADAYFCR